MEAEKTETEIDVMDVVVEGDQENEDITDDKAKEIVKDGENNLKKEVTEDDKNRSEDGKDVPQEANPLLESVHARELVRALHTGTRGPVALLPIQGRNLHPRPLLWPLRCLARQDALLPLHACLAARDSGLVDPGMLLLYLNGCLQVDTKEAKTEAYAALAPLVVTAEDLLEFLYFHGKVFRSNEFPAYPGRRVAEYLVHQARSLGTGRGLRTLVARWYHEQEPLELCRQVTRARARHGRSHGDILKDLGIQYSPKNVALAAVMKYLMWGPAALARARGRFEAAPEVLGFLAASQEVRRATDAGEAARLIRQHGLDVSQVAPLLLDAAEVWLALLPGLDLPRLLEHLRPMAAAGLLAAEDSPVLRLLLGRLQSAEVQPASRPGPVAAAVALAQVRRSWAPQPGRLEEAVAAAIHPSLAAALEELLQTALGQVARAEGRVLVVVDCRRTLATNFCWGAPGVACADAVAITVLALRAGGATVDVFVRAGDGLEEVALEERVGQLAARLTRVEDARVVEPNLVVTWARRTVRAADLVLVVTDCHTEVRCQEELWEELAWYREEVEGAAACRFVYSVLGSRGVPRPVAREGDLDMLDICGWDHSYLTILQAFLTHKF